MPTHPTVGTPERLVRGPSGPWRLQLEHLVYVGQAVLRPQRIEVQGEDAILDHLRAIGGGDPLARDAERVFSRTQAAQEADLVPRDGRWVMSQTPCLTREAGFASESSVASLVRRLEQLESKVRALTNELAASRREHEELKERVLSAPVAAPVRMYEPDERDDQPAHYDPPARPQAASPRAQPAPAAVESQPIRLPELSAIVDLIRSLAGSEGTLLPASHGGLENAHCSLLEDNDGQARGALVLDHEAAVRLAGALLMESPESIAVLLEESALTPELHDAASEVCNTLMSAFNKVSGNPHLKAAKLVPLDEHWREWLDGARHAEHYRYAAGGHITLVAR